MFETMKETNEDKGKENLSIKREGRVKGETQIG